MTGAGRTTLRAVRLGPNATIGAASGALATTMVPVFLVGALSPVIGADLGFDEAATGVIVMSFYLAAAVTAIPMGSLTERLGAGRAMRTGVLVSAIGCAVTASLVRSAWQLAVLMALLGVTLPLVDTGTARAFATSVPINRRGRAFGVKEASVPMASLLAGLAVPLLAATVGWRLAFLGGVLVAPVIVLSLNLALPVDPRRSRPRAGPRSSLPAVGAAPDGEPDPGRPATSPRLRRPVRLLAVSFALAGAGAAAVVTFLVPTATANGMSSARAGLTLAVASGGGIVARLAAGAMADRAPATLGPALMSAMLAGAIGTAGLAMAPQGIAFVVVAVLTLTAGWGWTGLGFAALTQATPQAPATAAGAGILGLAVGGTLGPVLFGRLVVSGSYPLGWTVISGLFLAGTICAYLGLRMDRFLAPD